MRSVLHSSELSVGLDMAYFSIVN